MSKPKVILFDIGGVCVVSPIESIQDYERKHGIPKNYINFAIARASPNGAWQRLERGEVKMDGEFFDGFNKDINDPEAWKDYHLYFKARQQHKSLKQIAATKATQLGDPVSLKAETSSTDPTPDEKGAPQPSRPKRRSFKDAANRTMLGDPISLKTEKSSDSALPDDSGAPPVSSSEIPPQPTVDTTTVFWDMMAWSRRPDPHVFPAVLALRDSKEYIVAALSNTVIFPPDHEYAQPGVNDPRQHFDLFISSAHVGLRKPDPRIYRLTLEKLDQLDRARGGDGVRPDQVVFLDDIGSNLKTARDLGIRTIKVNLGHTDEAVKELERITNLRLSGEKSRL